MGVLGQKTQFFASISMIYHFVLDLPNMKFLTRKTWSQHPKRPGNWLATFLLKDSQEFCCAKVYFYHLKKNEPILTHNEATNVLM